MNTTTLTYDYDNLIERSTQQLSVMLTLDIYDWYREMQKSHAVYFDEARASWLVFRYDDVQRLLLETQTFSSQRTPNPDGTIDPIKSLSMIGMDPPRHRQLRALMGEAFTPRMIAELEPRITATVHRLLDDVQAKGTMDVVDDLAFPLSITTIAELLGVPDHDRETFRQWTTEMVGTNRAASFAAGEKIAHYFHTIIERRRKEPRTDMLSDLLAATVDGESLPENDLLGACLLLLIAGYETTMGLISNAIMCLDEHPDTMQQLRGERELIPSAIEEVVRYRSVIHTVPRIVPVDTVFCGQEMKGGDLVLPLFAAANLDETHFPHADTFDIRRTPNRHLGFGHGIHFCLGAPLARLEARIVLEVMLERLPNLQRVRTIPLELRPSPIVYGLKHLPITFGH